MINKLHPATNYSSFLSSITSNATIKVALLVFSCFLSISLLKSNDYAMDETVFHYPNLLNYYHNGLAATFNKDYSAANTPLPYIILALISKIFSPSIILARIITACFSFGAFLFTLSILTKKNVPPIYAFITLFYPYFFLNAFIFYAINYGLFFFVLTIFLLMQEKKSLWLDFLIGLSLAFAVLCQQFYLVMFATVPTGWLLKQMFGKKDSTSLNVYLRIAAFSLPAILPLLLFYKWGGLVHPNFKVHALSFFPTDLTGILIIIGFYFSPYFFQTFKKSDWWKLGVALIPASLLYVFFKPMYNDFNGPDIFTGIIYDLLNILEKKQFILSALLIILLISFGLMILVKLFEVLKDNFERLLFLTALLFIVTFAMNAVLGERHLLPLVFLLFLLIIPHLKITIRSIFLTSMMAWGVGYYFYWIFIKYNQS